jgi:uncharacterized repeat protein (TIGR02543 family)
MKKVMFVIVAALMLFTLTACDEGFTLPSGVTLPDDITLATDDLTTDDLTTEDLTTVLPTTDEATTIAPTTTEEPTTEIREITISFDSQDGSTIDDLGVFENTDNDDLDLPIPTKEGYTFDAWYTSTTYDQVFAFNSSLPSSITIYAKWTINQYTISFEENGGSIVTDITDDYLASVSEPDEPTKVGHTFSGWFSDDTLATAYVFNTIPVEDTTLYAKWTINQYTINFEENGGSIVTDITDDYLVSVSEPDEPTKVGHTFSGWFSDDTLATAYLFNTIPAEDTTLYAKWTINQYTINFEENDGSIVTNITQDYLSTIVEPDAPIKTGYTFDGWYTDPELVNEFSFDIMSSEDITVYVKWMSNPAIIHFVIDDFVNPDINGYTGDELVTLPSPELTGKNFLGWYEDETYTTLISWSTIPAGENTIYGLWEDIIYHITYEENDGTEVTNETHYYNDILVEPTPPTKDGLVFFGWFSDTEFLNKFEFTQMLDQDITLYARWVLVNSVLNQISQPEFSTVVVQGVIYHSHRSGTKGFYIYDETGFLYIKNVFANPSSFYIGDKVEISGLLRFDKGVPYLDNVTSVNELSQDNPLPIPKLFDLGDFSTIDNHQALNVYSSTGLIVNKNFYLHIFAESSLDFILVHESGVEYEDFNTIANNIGNLIELEYIFIPNGDTFELSIIDYTIIPLTISEQALLMKSFIEENFNLSFFPGDKLPVDKIPFFDEFTNFSIPALTYSIPTEYEVYFDLTNNQFLNTDIEVIIPLTVTLSINSTEYDFIINLTLMPTDLSTIADVINDTTLSYHTIEVMVIAKSEINMLLKDDTGYLYAYNLPYVQVGDIVQFVVRNDKDYAMTYLDYYDGDIVLHQIVSKENELNLIPNQLTNTDFLDIDPTDLSIYGEYVELRGFVKELYTDSYSGFYLTNDDYSIKIMTMNHSGFERLFEYINLEVYIRGFLYSDNDGNLQIFFEGIRQDIRIPDYTDQERVDVLIKIFNDTYGGVTYNAFDGLPMYPYHPILGGEITWAFSDLNFSYYDFDNQHFLYSDTDQPFTLNITITSGSVSEVVVFTSQLNQYTLTDFSQFDDVETYEPIFVEGLVVYRSPDFIYIMNTLGQIALVDIANLDVVVGDEILLYVQINKDYSYVNNMIYLMETYNINAVVEIISRQNDFDIPENVMSIQDLLNLENTDELNQQLFIKLDGIIEEYYGIPVLRTPDGYVVLSFVNQQTQYEFTNYTGQYINLKGYVLGERYFNLIGENAWEIKIVGEPNDIEDIELSAQETFDFIEAYIIERYQMSLEGETIIDFSDPDFYFNELIITYTTLDDLNGLFDFTNGDLQSIDAVLESTTITIQVDLSLELETYDFTFTITILPNEEIIITPIEDVIADGSTIQNISATVIITTMLDQDTYLFLLEDETGIIYATVNQNLFRSNTAYYHNYMNDKLLISGTLTIVNGKTMMMANDIQLLEESISIAPTFTTISIEDYLALDMTNPLNYGVAYEISGMVYDYYGDYGREYYLTDGENTIRLYAISSWVRLSGYNGLEVVVKVFSYDEDYLGNRAALYADKTYSSGYSVRIGEYTIQEQLELIKQSILDDHMQYNPIHNPGDYISLPSADGDLINTFNPTITEVIIQGSDYMESYGSYYNALQSPTDIEVVVKVTVTIETESEVFYYSIFINGFEYKTLDDLFLMDLGTFEIALEATVIYTGFDFQYLLIDNQIYALEAFLYGYFMPGDKVTIIGLKTIIDGIPNYTYDLALIDMSSTETLDLTPIETSIESLYTNDYSVNPLHLSVNRVYGFLEYDKYLGLYTLTDNDALIYINMYFNGWDYEDYLAPYLGEYIYINVLLPMKTVRNEYIMVDTISGLNEISIENYTAEQSVQIIEDRLSIFATLDVFSGERLDDYLVSEYSNHPYTTIEYTLIDPLDEAYIDMDGLIVGYVNGLESFDLLATITYLNVITGANHESTLQITVQVHPRQTASIEDVLYGLDGETYQIQGVIVALGPLENGFYQYAIIDDGQNRIYVQLGNFSYYTFNSSTVTLELNDEILIIAQRDYYDNTQMIPILSIPFVIEHIASDVVITNIPVQMSIEEIMLLTHSEPTLYYQYIEITDLFEWNSNTFNPIYNLRSNIAIADSSGLYYGLKVDTINSQSLHDTLALINNQEVTLTGYLIGYTSLNGYGEWLMIYESHVVVVE